MQLHIDVWGTSGHTHSFIKENLKDFHTGHPGMNRMKALMWSYVYWPGMDKDIENMVESCKNCTSVAKALPIKFNPWPKTNKP